MELIERITKDDPPTLKNPQEFSPGFIDFLARCLEKDAEKRASAESLITHPWVESCAEQRVNLGKWLQTRNCVIEIAEEAL